MNPDASDPMDVCEVILETNMEVDSSNLNGDIIHQVISNDPFNQTSPPKSIVNSVKKIKLSKEERELIKSEKEKLKQEREKLKLEKEMAKLEKEKARIEIEKAKLAVEQRLKEEREKRAQETLEKKLKQEQEKQEKLKLKEEERERKEREKREKEEERIKVREEKEKEKQRRIEEKLAIEEERKKKEEKCEENLEKSRAVLFNFLKSKPVQSDKSDSPPRHPLEAALNENRLIKPTIVPESLLAAFDAETFINSISSQNEDVENLYLQQLVSGKRKPYVHKKEVEVEIVEELPENLRKVRCILLKFAENVKPPYFGPKLKKSSKVNGRRPFKKDSQLDYEVDSDEEWDEGGPGESLDGSDSENDDKDDYEIDNDFMVPHGYLSDDEGDLVTGETETVQKKSGPLLKEQTLMAERSRRFAQKLRPQVIGCVWNDCRDIPLTGQYEFLQQFSRVLLPK